MQQDMLNALMYIGAHPGTNLGHTVVSKLVKAGFVRNFSSSGQFHLYLTASGRQFMLACL